MPAHELAARLEARSPLDLPGLFGFLRARAVPGVEDAGAQHYRRAVRLPGGPAVLELRPDLSLRARLSDDRDAAEAIARARALFDLDADPEPVGAVLRSDPHLAGLVRAHPGVRIPGCVDGAEVVVRAILGQQVSVAAARTAAARLTSALGEPLTCADGSITTLFPSAEALASGVADVLTGPRRRAETIRAACAAMADGTLAVHPGRDAVELRAELRAVPGIGPWTADYVVLRVLREPDLLLDGDLALRRGAARLGLPDRAGDLRAHAERWRPWRSYAGMLLWRAAAEA